MSRRSSSWGPVPLMALVALVSVSFVPPARAEDMITTQPYASLLNLGALKELNISNKGITIALIDGSVDTFAPELRSIDIVTVAPCPYTSIPNFISYGTVMVSLFVSPDYGIIPGTTIINHAALLHDGDSTQEDRRCTTGFACMATLAPSDGVDIISYSAGRNSSGIMAPILMKVGLDGTITVATTGNNSQKNYVEPYVSSNLTVGVAATDIHSNQTDYPNYGKGTTATFYGDLVSVRDCLSGRIYHETKGTSVATALTFDYLALAMEKWPEATNR